MHVCDTVRSLNHLVTYVKISMNNLYLTLIPAALIYFDNMVTCHDQWSYLDNLEYEPKRGRNIPGQSYWNHCKQICNEL